MPPPGPALRRPRVLLVEDDRELVALLDRLLTDEGYELEHAGDGQSGLHLLLTRAYDVIVLDRGLPVREGLDILAMARARGVATPTLVLSARGSAADRIDGLDAGAEDYLVKPFDVGELLARLRALRRRHLDAARSLPLGRLVLDLDTRLVHDGTNQPGEHADGIQLSQREAELLAVLAARPTRVFTRGELCHRVFTDADSEQVVDTYVSYCRRKLGADVVRTVRGVGYQFGSA